MDAPGTIVEGAEKPVMRAVVGVRREAARVRRVGERRILVVLVGGSVFGCGWLGGDGVGW